MFSNKLKRPALALAVTAGLLAVAGPASAQGGDRVGATSLKYETEVTDYVRPTTASDGQQGSPVSLVDKDLYQPDMGIREQPTQVNAPHGLSIGSSEVFELEHHLWNNGDGSGQVAGPTGLKFDSNEWAEDLGFTAPPEMGANANAFMPDVDDEVLAGVNYEPDFFW
jgi:hypothetical protein